MGRRGFPSTATHREQEEEDAAAAAAGYTCSLARGTEGGSRHVPPCIRTSRLGSRGTIYAEDESSDYDDDEEESTTPTAREARIPDRLPCPAAPRKRRPPVSCGGHKEAGAGSGGHKGFFPCPADLEAVFARRKHVQPAK